MLISGLRWRQVVGSNRVQWLEWGCFPGSGGQGAGEVNPIGGPAYEQKHSDYISQDAAGR